MLWSSPSPWRDACWLCELEYVSKAFGASELDPLYRRTVSLSVLDRRGSAGSHCALALCQALWHILHEGEQVLLSSCLLSEAQSINLTLRAPADFRMLSSSLWEGRHGRQFPAPGFLLSTSDGMDETMLVMAKMLAYSVLGLLESRGRFLEDTQCPCEHAVILNTSKCH